MRYETTTKLAPDQAFARAEQFFGQTLGLTIREHTANRIAFEGGGGYIALEVVGEQPTTLDIETREWDFDARQFITQLPR